MIKVKRNRLKIFESLAPETENFSAHTNFLKQKELSKYLLKADLKSCQLDENLLKIGSNSIEICFPYNITEETLYAICRFYGDISYFKLTSSQNDTGKFTK
jgi:hypothetical protein